MTFAAALRLAAGRAPAALAFALGALALALAIDVLEDARKSSPKPYETRAGPATHLNGDKADDQALSIAETLRLKPKATYVRGYLLAAFDDQTRLCTRLEQGGLCRKPVLTIDDSSVDLYESPAMAEGCCATGLWSPRPVVVWLDFRGRTPRLIDR